MERSEWEMRYFLGVDVGTSLIKAALYDLSGRSIQVASRKVPVSYPREGYAEQNMRELWVGVAFCIRSLVEKLGDDIHNIAAMACSGQGDGLWAIDEQGNPAGNAILWCDNRASVIVEEWMDSGITEKFFEKSGNTLWPGCTAAILSWLEREDKQFYHRISNFFFCKDWINYNLTGVVATDVSDGTIPFMDLQSGRISKDQITLLGLNDEVYKKFPQVLQSYDCIGTVTQEASQITGLPLGLPIITGMIDVSSNAIAAGAIQRGQVFSILGTTLLNAILMDQPKSEPANVGFMLRSPLQNQWVRVMGSLSGTPNLDWILRELYQSTQCPNMEMLYKEIKEQVAKTPPGANKVLFLPFIHGERSPFVSPHATASFLGIRENTKKADMLRAVYEGVALAARHNLDSVVGEVREMVLTGGGSNDSVWCQILADITGAKIRVSSQKELGTLGAAIMAAKGIGAIDSFCFEDQVLDEQYYTPNPKNREFYNKLYDLYISTVEQIQDYWRKRYELFK